LSACHDVIKLNSYLLSLLNRHCI